MERRARTARCGEQKSARGIACADARGNARAERADADSAQLDDRESHLRIRTAEESCTMKCFRTLCVVALIFPSIAFAADDPLAGIHDLLFSGRLAEARDQLAKAERTFAARS